MELRVLEYFLAVAREQNITAAAQALHISQPALSTQLKNLEDELGKQLLIRGTRGSRKVVLTDEGMVLSKRAEEILSLVQRTEEEITRADEAIVGNVFIGTGESDVIRLFARAAGRLQRRCPDIRYNISSGNAEHVLEYLDKGLIDFGLLLGGQLDEQKYEFLSMPVRDVWGVLMRRDAPLAAKESIRPQDLWDKPLIVSHQRGDNTYLSRWLGKKESALHIVATYNLVYNASMLVDEGLGYALCYDTLVNTEGTDLCFRPLTPRLEAQGNLVWKRYQVFSKAAGAFLATLREVLQEENAKNPPDTK